MVAEYILFDSDIKIRKSFLQTLAGLALFVFQFPLYLMTRTDSSTATHCCARVSSHSLFLVTVSAKSVHYFIKQMEGVVPK